MLLEFNPDIHEYKENGIKIPSVTQILEESGLVDLSWISPELLEAKADLGHKVHQTTEYYDNDTLDVESLDPLLEGYLEGWIKFKADYKFEVLESELQLFHKVYRYAGTIDRIGKDLTLLDIKTGIMTQSHRIQTMGYKLLYDQDKKPKEQIKKRLCVYLDEFGKYKVAQHENSNDKNIFLSALTITNFKRGSK
jgi:hypothetical protein